MTRDDMLRMALECGLTINGNVMLGVERFAKLVAAHEREFCALACEAEAEGWRGSNSDAYAAVWDCAHAIRARGKTKDAPELFPGTLDALNALSIRSTSKTKPNGEQS